MSTTQILLSQNKQDSVAPLLQKLFQIYTSQSKPEQESLVHEICSPNVVFEDPMMRVYGLEEYRVQFYSLMRVFKNVNVQYDVGKVIVQQLEHSKSYASVTATDNATTEEPGSSPIGNPFNILQQTATTKPATRLLVPNKQHYEFVYPSSILSRVLPSYVDLQAVTKIELDQNGKVIGHRDVWVDKGVEVWPYGRWGKPVTGRVLSTFFKLLGW